MGYVPPSVPETYLQPFRMQPSIFSASRKVRRIEPLRFTTLGRHLATDAGRKRMIEKDHTQRKRITHREWVWIDDRWEEKGKYVDAYY